MASRPSLPQPSTIPTRLYLVTSPVCDPAAMLPSLVNALDAADVAAVLVKLVDADDRTLIRRLKALAAPVQDRGAALLIEGRPEIAARAGADGAHLSGLAAFAEAAPLLKPDRIAGCGGLASRHDAMVAADSGADYVIFGEPDAAGRRPSFAAVRERVAWWTEVFQVPCVGYAANRDEAGELAACRAEFVAVGESVWSSPQDLAKAVEEIASRLTEPNG